MKKIIAVCAAALLIFSGCTAKYAPVSRTDFVLDTICTITVYDGEGNQSDRQDIINSAFVLCHEYEKLLGSRSKNGDVYNFNSAGSGAELKGEAGELAARALEYSSMSGGAFDITLGSVTPLWDFKAENPSPPSQEALSAALAHTGADKLALVDGGIKKLDPDVKIDLGAIAKGYIADRLKESLERDGISSAIINLGGNIVTIGLNPDKGRAFSVGIQLPFSEQNTIAGTIDSIGATVTSGAYQRNFEYQGRLYHHILDPETGMPAQSGLASVTILSESAEQADALSTICFVLGEERAMELIKSLEGVEAVFIDEDMNITQSSEVLKSIDNEK